MIENHRGTSSGQIGLQRGHLPSAARSPLGCWSVPGPHGATIEFASVDVHDEYGIPD